VPGIDGIRSALVRHRPEVAAAPPLRAAVAMVLRPGSAGPEVLLIERAERADDPWSGHMAFPGGRVGPGDASARSAAERETAEEVGLDLAAAEPLGRLDDLEGRHAGRPAGLVISAFVYHLEAPPALRPNHEVREALWVPLGRFLEPERHIEWRFPRQPEGFPPYPGIVVGDPARQVVWGLTYRFLERFFAIVGRPLPDRWERLREAGLR
jgi:8-oxo-dGTP pyrophosphatase MutT (NUDIX family)